MGAEDLRDTRRGSKTKWVSGETLAVSMPVVANSGTSDRTQGC
jgi:hypothetical protein